MTQLFSILTVYKEVIEVFKRHHIRFTTLTSDSLDNVCVTHISECTRIMILQTPSEQRKGVCKLIISEGFYHEFRQELFDYYLEPEM